LLLSLVGCGGSSSTPSSPSGSPSSGTASLQAGNYYLSYGHDQTLSDSSAFSVCSTAGTLSIFTTVRVPVSLEGSGTAFTGRAANGTLLLNVSLSGSAVTLTLQGSATDESGALSMTVLGTEPLSVAGQITADRTAAGTALGAGVRIDGATGSAACTPSAWYLQPR
jgi:hypothetical protein